MLNIDIRFPEDSFADAEGRKFGVKWLDVQGGRRLPIISALFLTEKIVTKYQTCSLFSCAW